MAGQGGIEALSGIEVTPEALATARELAAAVRAAAADLPFEAEPAAFLVALEELAAPEEPRP